MRQFLYSVVIILTFLGLSYLFLCLIGLDLILIFFFSSVSKVGFLLGGRVLSFYLLKLGCHGVLACGIGLAVRSLLAAEATPFVANMMLPGGVSDASSSSGDWRGYLNWPSPEEGDSAPGPSTARAPALRGEEALHVASSSTATPGQQWETGVDPGQPPMVAEQAGPSHQAAIVHNRSLESSIRSRIRFLEDDSTIFLLDKEKGEYWNEIRGALEQAPSREEYTRLLEFENRDLRIRELKHSCFSQFRQVLSEQPALKENTDYEPEEALIDFFNKKRNELDAHREWNIADKDEKEIELIARVAQDIRERGPDSNYMSEILS